MRYMRMGIYHHQTILVVVLELLKAFAALPLHYPSGNNLSSKFLPSANP